MAQGDVTITVVGNLTNDPELRFTPCGAAVANFTVASTPRILDKKTNEWKDGDTLFLRCSVWRQYAENVAESLHPRHARHRHGPAQGSARTRPARARSGTVGRVRGRRRRPGAAYATAKVTKASQRWRLRWRRWRWRVRRRRSAGGGPQPTTTRGPAARAPRPGGGFTDEPPSDSPSFVDSAFDHCLHLCRGSAPTGAPRWPSPPFASRRRRSVVFCKDKITYIDYKDTNLLRKFISDRGKIRARRVTGNCSQHQRDIAIGGEEQPRDGAAALHQHRSLRGLTMKLILTQEVDRSR